MIRVIDDFLNTGSFVLLREKAINAQYVDWAGPDRQVYKRISILDENEELYMDVKRAISFEFEMIPINMLGMAFRLNYEGEPPNQAIHTDVGWGTHALVLYLNDGPSGTAFWRHESGAERLGHNDFLTYAKVMNDWTKESKWEVTSNVLMKANRAVIYESELFHSRYPFEAFGSTPEDGRLILVAFFTPKGN